MDQKVVSRGSALGRNDYSGTGRKPFFYGWVMVVVSFAAQGIGFGNQYFTGLFLQPFKDTFQASSAAVLLATSGAMSLALAIGFPLCGMVANRYSIRKLLLVGIGCIGAGYLLLAHAQQLWQVAAIYGLFFAVGALSCTVGGQTLVSNWFVAKRGFALGLSITGVPVAGFVVAPLAAYAIDHLGWSTLCLIAAAVFFVLAPLVSWLVVEKPENKGLWPDGAPGPVDDKVEQGGESCDGKPLQAWTLRKVLGTSRFWIIACLTGACVGPATVLLANLMPLAQHANIDRQSASFLISCAAATGVLANIAFGALFDSVSQRVIVAIPPVLLGVCCALLLTSNNYWALLVASGLAGATFSAVSLMQGVLAGINFGREAFALVFGAIGPVTTGTSLVLLFLFGRTFDVFASYDPILIAFLSLFGVTLLFSWLVLPAGRQGVR